MSFNRPDPMFARNRHVAIGSKDRPVSIQDAVYSRLVKMAEDYDDCNFARCLLQQVCEIFKDEIDALKTVEPLTKTEREYLAGWEDALETVCNLASLCLGGPLEDEDLSDQSRLPCPASTIRSVPARRALLVGGTNNSAD
ncbi:hypothetical protein Ct61P_12461 [Colletotrichum tofieldiae]|nr:hypothetical protein Ct61P_12461 [Colletotrichum tofieldiae]